MPHPRSDLHRLFADLADGTILDGDFRRLEGVLAEDRTARDELRAWMAMEAALPWVLGSDESPPGVDGSPLAPSGPTAEPTPQSGPPRKLAGMWLVPLILAAGGLAAGLPWRGAATKPAAWVAIADASADAVWHDGVPRVAGDLLQPGVMRLDRGAVQVRFVTGAVVALNAPVEFEVLGPKRMFLRSGRITSLVPPEAHGFTVVSPDGEVVDFGTEFTVGVERDGKTHVYVVDGEVEVAAGHSMLEERMRLTQGFATRLETDTASSPRITQHPIVLDSFERARGSAGDSPLELHWKNVDPDEPAEIRDGGFRIPIDGGPERRYPIARVELDHDFSVLAGRRSHVSFKATLPNVGTASIQRWAGVVVDDRRHDAEMAYKSDTHFGVLVSPSWQAQVRVKGREVSIQRVFARDVDAIGPYQVVMVIDDSAAGRARFGGAVLTVIINGMEIVRDQPVELCSLPRIQFQTNTLPRDGGHGFVVIDDVCVSVEVDAESVGL